MDTRTETQVQATSRRFREFKVIEKTCESAVICSFLLEPVDGEAIVAWQPGQYLVFKLQLNGTTVLRNYSMSACPEHPRGLRVAIKKEPAPLAQPDVPPGMVSNYFHDQVQVGDVLTAAGPMGDFVLQEDSDRPVVLLSGGVGITPMLSMLHKLVKTSQRKVTFIHACENGDVHAFADEVAQLAQLRDGVQVHYCYRDPSEKDRQNSVFHSEGLLSKQQIQALLPLDDYEFYLCGPSIFMQVYWRLLRELGVNKERIFYEFFGPATVLENEEPVQPEPESSKTVATVVTVVADQDQQGVTFLPDQVQAVIDTAQEQTLLELAEANGLSPDFNCRAGLCNTCMCTLVSGEVEYIEEPLDLPPEGKVLLCCAKPIGAVTVDLTTMGA